MDQTKTVIGEFFAKALSLFIAVLPPVIAANIAHWSHTEISGRKFSKKARLAVFAGSFSIACVIHYVCVSLDILKYEWVIIWAMGISTEHVLKFMYVKFWDIARNFLITYIEQILGSLKKSKEKQGL
jgi:hypothetical protein